MGFPKPYFENRKGIIYHADSREILPLLQSADVVLTDPQFFLPPVGHGAKGKKEWCGSLGDLVSTEESYRWFFNESSRLLKGGGHLYLCCHDRSYPVFFRLAYTRWPRVKMIVWYKPTGRVGKGWRRAHELVLHGAFKQTAYTNGFRLDVVGIMPVRTMKRGHPAEKPGELGDFLLEAVPSPGLVVDPFMGSGSFGEASLRNGFNFIGVEIEEKYCELAASKLERARQLEMEL